MAKQRTHIGVDAETLAMLDTVRACLAADGRGDGVPQIADAAAAPTPPPHFTTYCAVIKYLFRFREKYRERRRKAARKRGRLKKLPKKMPLPGPTA